MTVETSTYLSQLNSSYPAAGDPKSEGDDHIRKIKANLLATFPNLTAAAVTPSTTELNYVAGVTSAIQTQLNAKAPTASPTFTGTVTIPAGASITGFAPLASPTFTGTPAAPTATATDNTTQIATTAMVQSALVAYSGTNLGLPTFSSGDAYKLLTLNSTGSGYVWTGSPTLTAPALVVVDKGNSGTSTQTYSYAAGTYQTSTATGNHTIAFSNWPATGTEGVMQVVLTNGGAYTITWPTISWIKPDGTTTTSISTYLAALTGRTALQTSGVDQFIFWTRDAGTTVYGKLV